MLVKKRLLLATVAIAVLGFCNSTLAADMPLKAPPPPPPPPPFSWTGFYIGGNLGAAWGERHVTDRRLNGDVFDFSRSSDGVFIGGGQLGYNWQMNNFVLGIEWDFDGAGSNNHVGNGIPIGNGTFALRGGGDRWMSTLAARLGFANDHWLFYAKLGVGEVGVSNFIVTNTNTGVSVASDTSRSRTGGMFGLGLEYAFTNNWTMKAEYDWIGLSSRAFVVPVGAPILVGDVFTTGSSSVQTFKVGFNYLFGRSGY
jgi:outer membrane immunogenic protein